MSDDDDVANFLYDVTPPEFIAGVATEIGILPCISVPIIVRKM